jgi:hypothetical protein
MGCAAGGPQQQRRVRGKATDSGAGAAAGQAAMSPSASFEAIVNGVKGICTASDMLPVMCLSRDAFPVVISLAPPEDTGTSHPIRFPVVAGSLFGSGRVICFSQLQWISTNLFRRAHNSKLIANSIGWLSGSSGKMTNVMMLGFDKNANTAIASSLKEIGVFSEAVSASRWNPESFDLRKFKVVIIPTHRPQ